MLHKLAVEKVCAEFQSAAVHELIDKGLLTEQETEVYKRGRNASGINPPRHSSVEELFGIIWEYGENDKSK